MKLICRSVLYNINLYITSVVLLDRGWHLTGVLGGWMFARVDTTPPYTYSDISSVIYTREADGQKINNEGLFVAVNLTFCLLYCFVNFQFLL